MMRPEAMRVQDDSRPPSVHQLNPEHDPVIVRFLGLPALEIAAVHEIELYPCEPELESTVEGGTEGRRPKQGQGPGDEAHPRPTSKPVIRPHLKYIFPIREGRRLAATYPHMQQVPTDGRRQDVNGHWDIFLASCFPCAEQEGRHPKGEDVGAQVGLRERSVALVVQPQVEADSILNSVARQSGQPVHPKLGSTVQG